MPKVVTAARCGNASVSVARFLSLCSCALTSRAFAIAQVIPSSVTSARSTHGSSRYGAHANIHARLQLGLPERVGMGRAGAGVGVGRGGVHTHTQPTKHERTAWLAVGWLVGWLAGCALWSVCLFVSVGVTVSVRPIVAGRHARPIEREIDVVLTVESAVDVMSESASK